MGKQLHDGHTSLWHDEQVLETAGGGGCHDANAFTPLNHRLQNDYNGNSDLYISCNKKEWNNEAAKEKHGQMFLCRKTFRRLWVFYYVFDIPI